MVDRPPPSMIEIRLWSLVWERLCEKHGDFFSRVCQTCSLRLIAFAVNSETVAPRKCYVNRGESEAMVKMQCGLERFKS